MAYVMYAFNDTVGVTCSKACADAAQADLQADYGHEADAGSEPLDRRIIAHCMSCGKVVSGG